MWPLGADPAPPRASPIHPARSSQHRRPTDPPDSHPATAVGPIPPPPSDPLAGVLEDIGADCAAAVAVVLSASGCVAPAEARADAGWVLGAG